MYKVTSNSIYVNKEVILAGNAKVNVSDKDLLNAQSNAQNTKMGIWKDWKKPFPWFEEFTELKMEVLK